MPRLQIYETQASRLLRLPRNMGFAIRVLSRDSSAGPLAIPRLRFGGPAFSDPNGYPRFPVRSASAKAVSRAWARSRPESDSRNTPRRDCGLPALMHEATSSPMSVAGKRDGFRSKGVAPGERQQSTTITHCDGRRHGATTALPKRYRVGVVNPASLRRASPCITCPFHSRCSQSPR